MKRRFLVLSAIAAALIFSSLSAFAQGSQTVRDAQQALKDKGFDPGPIDGIDGPQTKAAVREYQTKQNLTADGRLGPQTLDSLGVKPAPANTDFKEAGTNVKSSYSSGGKTIAHGGKEAGSEVAHGHPIEASKDLGKGVGKGAEKIGAGTGHAAENAAKGVKNAVTGDNKKSTTSTKQ